MTVINDDIWRKIVMNHVLHEKIEYRHLLYLEDIEEALITAKVYGKIKKDIHRVSTPYDSNIYELIIEFDSTRYLDDYIFNLCVAPMDEEIHYYVTIYKDDTINIVRSAKDFDAWDSRVLRPYYNSLGIKGFFTTEFIFCITDNLNMFQDYLLNYILNDKNPLFLNPIYNQWLEPTPF